MVSIGETPTLTEVRKWENNLWKQIHDLNIYEMGKEIFLFEFTSKTTAEQVVEVAMQFLKACDAWETSLMEKSNEPNAKIMQGEVTDIQLKETEQDRSDESEAMHSQERRRGFEGLGKNIVKSALLKWKAYVCCFQEKKISREVESIAKQLWASRWMSCGYLEVDGSNGGILIMWDCRIWKGSLVETGKFLITYRFDAVQTTFSWYLTGVYACHIRNEKLECWEEVATVKELCEGTWVTCEEFNTVRVRAERRGCNRIANMMKDFSNYIKEMELHDLQLNGGNFTWFRGANHHSVARLERMGRNIQKYKADDKAWSDI
ncbi:hypothetical protein H5410_031349 [Solanum commersonii]|uniref:DUF4283 domain-containing protein n=1 Tax=Solanum commersonii TaxID=4109 RepID=A0A9J5YGW3_SOLCO|nr:hypothetical protein H5410_031349 [Solanum commersonii]